MLNVRWVNTDEEDDLTPKPHTEFSSASIRCRQVTLSRASLLRGVHLKTSKKERDGDSEKNGARVRNETVSSKQHKVILKCVIIGWDSVETGQHRRPVLLHSGTDGRRPPKPFNRYYRLESQRKKNQRVEQLLLAYMISWQIIFRQFRDEKKKSWKKLWIIGQKHHTPECKQSNGK